MTVGKAKWVPADSFQRAHWICDVMGTGSECSGDVVEVSENTARCVKHGGTDHEASPAPKPDKRKPARWTIDAYPSGRPRRICRGGQVVVVACGDSPAEWRAVRALVRAANRVASNGR